MAASAISLPEDILVEIHLKLPVESLVLLRLVSKAWHSLISNRRFNKLYLRQSVESNTDNLLVIEGSSSEYVIKSSSSFYEFTGADNWYQHHPYLNRQSYSILCFCDGLMMIRKIPYLQDIFLVIWNPTTGEIFELPVLESFCCFKIPYGLGYDWSTDDYKVVYGAYTETRYKITLMVFSLKSNSWRKSMVFNYKISETSGTDVNGVLYWLDCSRKFLIAFKLAEEKIVELPLPDDISADEERSEHRVLGDLKGRLCLSQSYSMDQIYTLNVWLMKEDGGDEVAASWIKFITIPQMPIYSRIHLSVVRLFCFSKQAVFVMTDFCDDIAAVVFDLEQHELVEVRRFDGPCSRRILALFRSLVSPK